MSLELTEEERWLIRTRSQGGSTQALDLVPVVYKLMAGKMKAEFWRDHQLSNRMECQICGTEREPRHNWTDDQWLEAAKKKLIEKGSAK